SRPDDSRGLSEDRQVHQKTDGRPPDGPARLGVSRPPRGGTGRDERPAMTTTFDETSVLPVATAAEKTAPPKKTRRAAVVFPALLPLGAAGGGGAYLHGLGVESTDDAQVEGHLVNVATRVPGQVKSVRVQDNQLVEAGDVLVEIDDADYVARLAGARADLASA